MILILCLVLAYLAGSVSSAILVCRMLFLPDPRTHGSGNPGATNVLRLGGRRAAIMTLAGDMLKGLIPILIGVGLGVSGMALGFVGFAAVLGHLFPVFFRFHGGKGIATFFGMLAGLAPILCFLALVTWLLTALLTRYASLASLMSVLLVALLTIFVEPAYLLPMALTSLLLLYRHHGNILALWTGQERRLGP